MPDPVPTPETPETPPATPDLVGSSGESETADPSPVTLDQKVTLGDGSEVSIQDLVSAREEAAALRSYQERARRLMVHDGSITPQWEEDIRAVMADARFEPDAIDSYIEGIKNPTTEEEPTVPTNEPTSETPQEDPRDQMISELRSRLDRMEQEQGDTRAQHLERELDDAVGQGVDADQGIKVLLAKMRDLHGDSDEEKRKEVLVGEVRDETMAAIRRRRAAGGQFNLGWFREEAEKAAATVAAKYRSVIGDPNLIGRAPETEAGSDHFTTLEPVKPPDLPRNASAHERQEAARAFAEGTLLELASKANQGSESKA